MRSDFLLLSRYRPASFKKLAMIRRITRATGKAAMMETVWRLAMELSENTRAMGKRISITAQKNFTARWGSSSPVICL